MSTDKHKISIEGLSESQRLKFARMIDALAEPATGGEAKTYQSCAEALRKGSWTENQKIVIEKIIEIAGEILEMSDAQIARLATTKPQPGNA